MCAFGGLTMFFHFSTLGAVIIPMSLFIFFVFCMLAYFHSSNSPCEMVYVPYHEILIMISIADPVISYFFHNIFEYYDRQIMIQNLIKCHKIY